MNEQTLRELITLFLRINPDPADDQVHALAFALKMDKETLESVMYKMLAEGEGSEPVHADTQEEKVLDGDYDPEATKPDDLLLNDGAPETVTHDQEMQDALYSDGVGEDDQGVGIESDKGMMYSDGTPPLELRAATRLKGQ